MNGTNAHSANGHHASNTMNKAMDFNGRWVLVTGASAGLGKAMAENLALEHKANLIVSARRADRLEALKKDLESRAGVRVETVVADLSRLEDTDRLLDRALEQPLYAAILNAGVTHFGHHHELPFEDFQKLLHTNVTSVVRMTSRLLPHLEARNEGGGLLIVSSMAGISPVPYQTAYSATKAFLVHYGCCLWHELQGKNVSITTYAPGGIVTEMTAGEKFNKLRGWLLPVDDAAREGIDALRKRKYLHIGGRIYRLGAALMRMVPRRLAVSQVAGTYRKAVESARGES